MVPVFLNLRLTTFLSLFGIFHALPSWENLEANLTKNNYDIPPWTYTGQATRIATELLFTHVQSPTLSELGTSFHLIQEWEDVRLKYNASSILFAGKYVLLDLDKYVYIWTPDSYITNAISETQHNVIKPNMFIRIYPNGTLVKSTRLTVRTPCPLTSVGFPRGSQSCTLVFESYSFTTSEVNMTWNRYGAFKYRDEFSTSGLEVSSIKEMGCSTSSEINPCLKIKVNIVRDFSQLILRIYIPSVFLVILGWMSMWIDKGQVGARTSLGVLCVLSVVTQLVGVVSMGSGLEGLIAVDIWMAMCMFFTIMALCVFAVVHNIKRRKEKTKDKTKQKYKQTSTSTNEEGCAEEPCCDIPHGRLQNVFRLIYPLLFMIFNIVYWVYFLSVD
ncbi:glutamate-gated chloride channel alpha-like [Ostrea edulis]|uniref:glutamate-gated chloride channel alpha-like n=1 Tax=Ostrea edulis TaxID=37623 RepID=UPI002094DC7B|nr:glutamate-gated chloride channel alpha-like [Ostrea edulis]XP_048778077.1 glutamate-gated chloride channel alpha-like [Ostrea edulis]XP_048778079.1 glutamate-gated chloride channel alpha-like [Ostrea edulis]XP_048778080.1 glutamate-gated chloride channel alpha-like [Ostrea edulis]XP_048778082.1 glutamate-gated chloride channel alpha-like [Ostrea edulis]XP_056012355.1 glutamate-gated chloride channel alpha-like [Ostrea edulis]